VDELVDSRPLLGDWAALRQRIADDGYVFVRGLLEPEIVRGIGTQCLTTLERGGWRAEGPARATSVRDSFRDRTYRQVLRDHGFNAIPTAPQFDRLMREIMGPNAILQPIKLIRVVYPTAVVPQQPGGIVHKDYSVVQDMFTTWVPLVDVPRDVGGLAVRAGSQHHAAFRPRPMNDREPGWSTTDYAPGDVLVFHCLTSHAALPNHSTRLRLSAEYRWQLSDDPLPPRPRVDGRQERRWPPPPSRFVEFSVP
jgi:hypothetical protein